MEELRLAIQSLGAIKAIAEGLIAFRDESKVAEVKMALFQRVIEVQQVLMELQQENAAVHQENRLLKEQAHEAQKRTAQLDGYELYQPISGVFVRATKPVDGARPQPPYLCKACYDNGTKSALNFKRAEDRLKPATLQCPAHARHELQLQRGITAQMLADGIPTEE